MTGHLLCFGLGYSARALAFRLSRDGWRISGTSRTEDGVRAIDAEGWQGVAFDGLQLNDRLADLIGDATHVLLSVPPGERGDPVHCSAAQAMATAPNLSWVGYLSTVGVYGDQQGGWVDETTPVLPGSLRGRRRVDAELAWLAFGAANSVRVEVFRLPGIYGPQRSVLDAVRDGRARRIIKPGQVFNRIHVEDIAGAISAAIHGPSNHTIYNLTDDEPSAPQDVVVYAAALLGVAPPPAVQFEAALLTPMAASFYSESKRVSNRRMKVALGYTLCFPTYREGLAAIAQAR